MKKRYSSAAVCLFMLILVLSFFDSSVRTQASEKPVKTITLSEKSKKMTVGDTFKLKVKSVRICKS